MKTEKKTSRIASRIKTSEKFFSPNQLAERWLCSRTSVDRIAARAGLSRVYLGSGKNGMVRYLREEVVAYEEKRRTRMTP